MTGEAVPTLPEPVKYHVMRQEESLQVSHFLSLVLFDLQNAIFGWLCDSLYPSGLGWYRVTTDNLRFRVIFSRLKLKIQFSVVGEHF